MYNKRALAFMLIMVLAVSIMGCKAKSGNLDLKDKTVVAKVNGEVITKGEFNALYNQIRQSYSFTDEIENDPEQKAMIDQLKVDILDQMVREKLIIQKAKEAGFEVNDQVLKEAKAEFEGIISDLAIQMEDIDMAMGQDQDSDGQDYIEKAKAYIDEQLEIIGQTQDEYIEFIAQQIVIDRYIDSLVEDVYADEDEIREYYEETLNSQRENIASIAYDEVELYQPEEVRVKHILIGLPQDEMDEYDGLMAQGKEEEAKKYLDEKLKGIQPKALEVLEKARNGEDFEKLIEEYGEDPGMEGNEVGYIVRQNGDFVPEFEEASFNLAEGEISDLVASDFGYHIIKLYEKYPEKIFTLEEKHDEVKEILSQQKKVDAWSVILADLLNNADIDMYEDRL